MPKQLRSKNWVFTDFELLDLQAIWSSNEDIIKFMGWGEEICPKTKKKHYQGWIQMKNQKTMSGLKRMFGSKKTHWEPMQGTPEDSEKYCQKDGKYQCAGKFTTQGCRNDLEEIKLELDTDVRMIDIAKAHFPQFLQYGRAWKQYRTLLQEEKTRDFRKVEVIVHAGTTGTGKTRVAMESEPGIFKILGCQLRWWDGYEGQKTICIDEYANQIKITELLPLLDGYQMRLETKGGFTYAAWTKVYMTTNLPMLHEQAIDEHKAALKRRISKWITFNILK